MIHFYNYQYCRLNVHNNSKHIVHIVQLSKVLLLHVNILYGTLHEVLTCNDKQGVYCLSAKH